MGKWISVKSAIESIFNTSLAGFKDSENTLYCDSYYWDNYWEQKFYFHSPIVFKETVIWFSDGDWNQENKFGHPCRITKKYKDGGSIMLKHGRAICIYK